MIDKEFGNDLYFDTATHRCYVSVQYAEIKIWYENTGMAVATGACFLIQMGLGWDCVQNWLEDTM